MFIWDYFYVRCQHIRMWEGEKMEAYFLLIMMFSKTCLLFQKNIIMILVISLFTVLKSFLVGTTHLYKVIRF